jgi:hypothetical protein
MSLNIHSLLQIEAMGTEPANARNEMNLLAAILPGVFDQPIE